jgi:hypothetical protein
MVIDRTPLGAHGVSRQSLAARFGLAIALLVVIVSCNDPTATPIAGPPAAMLIVSGDSQTATVGTELAAPVVVKVTDTAGLPVTNQIVNFRVVAGGGTVFAGASLTNADGVARERWTLGTVAGADQKLEARAVDPSTGAALVFAEFGATAVPGVTSRLALSTEAAGAASGTAFTTQPVVTLRDAAGNIVTTDNSTVVTITASGNGIVIGTAAATASSGVATFSTVGIRGTAGTSYTLSFGATGVTPATQAISLTPGPIASVAVSPGTASLFVSSEPLTAVAKDADDNVVAGASMTWASLNEALATVSASGVVTPVAEGTVLITATAAEKSDTSTVTVLPFTFATIAAGGNTCGLSSAGVGFCWGSTTGNGSTSPSLTPVPIEGGHTFSVLAAGFYHDCGLTSAGKAYCWGDNGTGKLGDGTTIERLAPVEVAGGLTFMALSLSGDHTCALTTAGAAYCWGANPDGELGDGTTTTRTTPTAVQGGHVFTSIVTGIDHGCGLTAAGQAYCWGGGSGQLGNGTKGKSSTPVAVEGGLTFVALAAGQIHTCGLTGAGAAYCWGGNPGGSLGDGTTSTRSSPTAVLGDHVFATLTAGLRHTCATKSSGEAYCWGTNQNGPLGNGTQTNSSTPVPVQGSIGFTKLFAGSNHTCGLTSTGVAYCWGQNYGALGDGTTTQRLTPVAVVRR